MAQGLTGGFTLVDLPVVHQLQAQTPDRQPLPVSNLAEENQAKADLEVCALAVLYP
jgi:hypothetical protein